MTPEEKLWSSVDRSGGVDSCWNWQRSTTSKGYGVTYVKGKQVLAHRLALNVSGVSIPDGMYALHRCDNPRCCNPAHLFLGTKAENNADMHRKMRHSFGERHKRSKLTSAQVEEIKAARTSGKTQREVAAMFGIGQTQVWRITNGLNRRHG